MRKFAKAAILIRILKAITSRARVYLRDPKKMEALVTDAQERALVAEQAGSMAHKTLGTLSTMGRMGRAFVRREYRSVPWGTLVGATAAVLYFVLPLDFIPDILVGMGLVDDAALIAFVATRIMGDLDKFSAWERSRVARTIDGTAIVLDGPDAARLMASGVMEDVYLEPAAEPEPLLSDAAIREAADAVMEAVEEAEEEQAAVEAAADKADKAADKATRKAEKAAKKAAEEAEKAARKEAKARKKTGKE